MARNRFNLLYWGYVCLVTLPSQIEVLSVWILMAKLRLLGIIHYRYITH